MIIFIVLILAGLDQLRTESRMTQAYYYAKNSSRNVLSHIRQWLFFSIFFKRYFFRIFFKLIIITNF